MRKIRSVQSSIFDLFADHDIGRELKQMSAWLDRHAGLCEAVARDLGHDAVSDTGCQGLPAESVLRCALLKQYHQLSYTKLAFHLLDSASFQAFARLPKGFIPKKSALQGTISRIRAETWEQINQQLLRDAQDDKVESGNQVRLDSTVTASDIHAPSDSSLLWDSVRIMVRLIEEGLEASVSAQEFTWSNHSRAAKKRAREILSARGEKQRKALYRNLLNHTHATVRSLRQLKKQLRQQPTSPMLGVWFEACEHYLPLIGQIIGQTERRILCGERVPVEDKLFSLFEDHTDMIVKNNRDIQYGHKLNLTSGKTGLVLDVVVEAGNPADSQQLLPMLGRHIAFYGKAPGKMAADGCYASQENLKKAKQLGVKDMVFHKKRGLDVEDMAKSPWVYRKLKNFRAGIEAIISFLKRSFGLSRCSWKGLEHFKSYAWSSVVTHNLVRFARLTAA